PHCRPREGSTSILPLARLRGRGSQRGILQIIQPPSGIPLQLPLRCFASKGEGKMARPAVPAVEGRAQPYAKLTYMPYSGRYQQGANLGNYELSAGGLRWSLY